MFVNVDLSLFTYVLILNILYTCDKLIIKLPPQCYSYPQDGEIQGNIPTLY